MKQSAPIHVALTAPILRAGMEPGWLTLIVLFDLLMLIVTTKTAAFAAIGVSLFGWFVGREMTKVDPQMIDVYFRHVRREWCSDGGYVPAQSEPGAKESMLEPMVKKAVPGVLG